MLRTFRKSIKKNNGLKFPAEMYNNIYGSIVICGVMFSENVDIRPIIRKWKKAKISNSITWTIKDENFIDKTLNYFGLNRPKNFPIAYVDSGVNCLFAPYINGEVYPLREDGIKTNTLENGKVYTIEF